MGMEVRNYGGFNSTSAYSYESRQVGASKPETVHSDKDKVQDYYDKLCKKFPQINFNTNGGVLSSSSNKVTVNLSQECLKKMANDPEFAKEVEWNLSGEAAGNSMIYGWAQRDGVVLGGRTVTYDANGNRESSCGGMRTANVSNKNNINKIQKKYKDEEEQWIKARRKRKEKEKLEKKRAEKRAEEKEVAERLSKRGEKREILIEESMADADVIVADAGALTEQMLNKAHEGNIGLIASFDAKA